MIGHQVSHGVIAQRSRIELIVKQLLHLLALRVNHKYALMVGTDPDPAALVGHHIPDLQRIGQRGNAMRLEEAVH